jgi:hypothetical protein
MWTAAAPGTTSTWGKSGRTCTGTEVSSSFALLAAACGMLSLTAVNALCVMHVYAVLVAAEESPDSTLP